MLKSKLLLLFLVGMMMTVLISCDLIEEEEEIYEVTFQVFDFDNNPLAGIKISPINVETIATTDKNGKATLTELEGDLTIQIFDENEEHIFEVKKVTPADQGETFEVTPVGPYDVTIKVKHDGEPLEDVGIAINGEPIVVTDQNGEAYLSNLVGESKLEKTDVHWVYYFTSLFVPVEITSEDRGKTFTFDTTGTIENASISGTMSIDQNQVSIVEGEYLEINALDDHILFDPNYYMTDQDFRGQWPVGEDEIDYMIEARVFVPFLEGDFGLEEIFVYGYADHPQQDKVFLGVYGAESKDELFEYDEASSIKVDPDLNYEDIDFKVFEVRADQLEPLTNHSITDF